MEVAAALSATIYAVTTLDQVVDQPVDAIFWYTPAFDQAVYQRALAICPLFAWFCHRNARLEIRLGGKLPWPVYPIRVGLDPESEVKIILTQMFSLK